LLDFLRPKPFKGQKGEISALAIAPDGSAAVTGAHPPQFLAKDAIVWELPEGRIARRLKGHSVGVFSAVYSPDSKLIATGGGGVVKGSGWIYDHAIRIWNGQGEPEGIFGDGLYFVHALCFSPDGRTLLSGSSNHAPKAPVQDGASLRLWDWSTHKEIGRFGSHLSAVHAVAFSPDGKLVVGGSTGMLAGGSFSCRAEDKQSLGFEGRTLRMWDVTSGAEIDAFTHWEWVNAVAFHPNGDYLSSAGKSVICWDCNTGGKVREYGQGKVAGFVHSAALSPDGRFLAFGTGGQEEPGAPYQNCFLRAFESATGALVAEWQHRYPVNALAFTPDGHHILAGGEFGELHYWHMPDGL
jgi:WD40 repeat protein